jgi:hypothetical protein
MKQLIAICLFAIFGASCSNSTDDASQTHDDLIPLKVGNYWVFENKRYNLSNQDSILTYYIDTMLVESKSVEGSKTLYNMKNEYPYSSESDGIWMYFYNDRYLGQGFLTFKYPSNVGDKNYSAGLEMQITTIAKDEIFKSDLGEFKCYRYFSTNSLNNIQHLICPKIGIMKIKNTSYSETAKDSIVFEKTLISYHLE